MPIPQTHTITLEKRAVQTPNDANYVGSCSCQWQALAHSLDRLEKFAENHEFVQMSNGHRVIIERGKSLAS